MKGKNDVKHVPIISIQVPVYLDDGRPAKGGGYTANYRTMINPVFDVWRRMGVIPQSFEWGVVVLPDRPKAEDLLELTFEVNNEPWKIIGGGSLLKSPISKAWIGPESVGLPGSRVCPGLFAHDKDLSGRMSRLNAEGRNGTGFAEKLEVELVRDGEERGELPFEDGFGYMPRWFANAIQHEGQKLVKFRGPGSARCSHVVTANLPMDTQAVLDAEPAALEAYASISGGKISLDNVQYIPEKGWLLDAESEMAKHPYLTEALSRRMQDVIGRIAFNLPHLKLRARVAVPARKGLVKNVAVVDKSIVYRMPQDNRYLIRVGGQDTPGVREEQARIAKMEVVQFTLASQETLITGCAGVLEDEDYYARFGKDASPLMIDAECVKLHVDGVSNVRKRCGRITLKNAVFNALMWYDAGCAVGANADWALDIGADFDGDLLFLAVVDGSSERLAGLLESMPKGRTHKIRKLKKLLSKYPEAWAEAMAECTPPIVQVATNMFMTIVAMKPELREKVARKAGFETAADLIAWLAHAIKCGTDIFKARLTEKVVLKNGREVWATLTGWDLEKSLLIVQTAIGKVTKTVSVAPWCRAAQLEFFLNDQKVPLVVENLVEWNALPRDQQSIAIPAWVFEGSPVLAAYRMFHKHAAIEKILGLFAESNPLSFYRDWAPKVSGAALAAAGEIKDGYEIVRRQTNFSDGQSTKTLAAFTSAEFQRVVQETKPENVLEEAWKLELGYALWKVAHSSEGKRAGAGVAFNGLTREMVLHILEDKPGVAEEGDIETLVVGLQYNVELPKHLHRWSGEVEVVDTLMKHEHRSVVVPVDTEGIRYTGTNAPVLSMVGTVSKSKRARHVPPGFYTASFSVFAAGKSAAATFRPL